MDVKPTVSIGLPVYNGANFLEETLESLLVQTYKDFEIIISDNASEDSTAEICQRYQRTDSRIKYYRNTSNIGAAANYRRTFELAKGRYFRWHAHDDLCLPEHLERCVATLDADATVVLCYSRTQTISEDGSFIRDWPSRPLLESENPSIRFAENLFNFLHFPIWGLVSTKMLGKTSLLGDFTEHDRPLLCELSLHGKFHELQEVLFLDREHPDRSVRAFDVNNPYAAVEWFNPAMKGKLTFPRWRLLTEYFKAVGRAPVNGATRIACWYQILRWAIGKKRDLMMDIYKSPGFIPLLGKHYRSLALAAGRAAWEKKQHRLVAGVKRIIDKSEYFILVDEDQMDKALFDELKLYPFLEKDGCYFGMPAGDIEAINELERLRDKGARYLVFTEATFWWLQHYNEFYDYLRSRYKQLKSSRQFLIFEL